MDTKEHAIIIIKNNKGDYLQYYDERWESYLFLNCKVSEGFQEQDIIKDVCFKLQLKENNLECTYLGEKIHTKYSVSNKTEKNYHHYFYEIHIQEMPAIMEEKEFRIDDISYKWYCSEELENDARIQEVNNDIVEYVKELEKNKKG